MNQLCGKDDRAVRLKRHPSCSTHHVRDFEETIPEPASDVSGAPVVKKRPSINSSLLLERILSAPADTITPSGRMARFGHRAGRDGRSLKARPSPLKEVSSTPVVVSRRRNGWPLPVGLARSVPPPMTILPLLSMATAYTIHRRDGMPTTELRSIRRIRIHLRRLARRWCRGHRPPRAGPSTGRVDPRCGRPPRRAPVRPPRGPIGRCSGTDRLTPSPPPNRGSGSPSDSNADTLDPRDGEDASVRKDGHVTAAASVVRHVSPMPSPSPKVGSGAPDEVNRAIIPFADERSSHTDTGDAAHHQRPVRA